VTDVGIRGVSGPDREKVVTSLTRAAEGMTTLHVEGDRLTEAVAQFPTIASVHPDASFPHGLVIEVTERPATSVAIAGSEQVAIAADGTILAGAAAAEDLPRFDVAKLPSSGRLNGESLAEALVLGAAPEPLRPLIRRVRHSGDYGVEVMMGGGIPLRFGTGARPAAKWAAAAAVLADPRLESTSYVDVRVPARPAAGAAAG
jgi:cell division septal protein FtsQ